MDTLAEWVWLLPVLPLLGALLNGALVLLPRGPRGLDRSDRRTRRTVQGRPPARDWSPRSSGPGVLLAAFALAVALFATMRGAGELVDPFIRSYGSWMPVGNLSLTGRCSSTS
jgi:hypothetical protein